MGDRFSADSGGFEGVGFAQMVALEGIDYSFGLEIEMVAEEVFDFLEGGLIVDEYQKLFVEEDRLEYLEAYLVVVHLSVGEQLLLRRRQILVHLLPLLHRGSQTQSQRNFLLWTFPDVTRIPDRIYCHQESLQRKNHIPSPHLYGRIPPSI